MLSTKDDNLGRVVRSSMERPGSDDQALLMSYDGPEPEQVRRVIVALAR